MITDTSPEPAREMVMLEQIEHDPDINQSTLATHLGVAVGTVNWHIQRMIKKGYVKVKRANNRRKLRYIITPEGIAFRARLTIDFIEQSMLMYRNTRQRVRELLTEVKRAGYDCVRIEADADNGHANDIADVCRLTCLEQNIHVGNDNNTPVLLVNGLKVSLQMEERA
jgi:DNA-binding MarR family transcriptional regulator